VPDKSNERQNSKNNKRRVGGREMISENRENRNEG